LGELDGSFEQYRLSEALMNIYKLIWDDFSSWFLEMVKPEYQQPIDATTYKAVISFFEDNLKLLHPFMPFITEEIWQDIAPRTPEQALIIASYPEITSANTNLIQEFAIASDVIAGIRTIRKDKNISFKEKIDFSIVNNEKVSTNFDAVIQKMGNTHAINYVTDKVDGALSFRVKSNEYFIPMSGAIDVAAEKIKLEEELTYTQGFLKSVQAKLSNERFVNNAPAQVIKIERQKEADALAKIETLQASLKSL
jgi:valyl-tRNA synthetase